MDERDLRGLVADVRDGRLSRRSFVQRMAAVGLTAPMAGMMLSHGGVAEATPAASEYKPTKAGGGGPLKLLFWQAPTLLNPHFATGAKDVDASRIFYEALAVWDDDGHLVPVLATEIPTVQNGALGADGTSVVWKLKPGVKWHDGTPFTADDLVFTWQFVKNPDAACTTISTYQDITVETIDDLTVRILFPKPTPFWADAFVGRNGLVLPKHLFADYTGSKSREAPANNAPVGTGPYIYVEFRPGDMLRGARNADYHVANRPFFDTVELKGGGDAVSAARAVLQTGDYDFAANLQVEDEVLKRLEESGKGRVDISFGNSAEFVLLNATDPNVEVDGQRSSIKTRHFAFSDPAVRQAMHLLMDRKSIAEFIYGRTGKPTANVVDAPAEYASKTTNFSFDIPKANALLDAAGWARGSDGVRAKDGKRMHFLFQTSTNGPRQKTQAIIKQAAAKAGIEIELKAVPASVFFSTDPGNNDTNGKFYADMEEFANTATTPDPGDWMLQYVSWQAPQKENKWVGVNQARWQSADFDALFNQTAIELDPVKRAALFIRMNDLAVADNVLPLVSRGAVAAIAKGLHAPRSGWDGDTWAIADWWRQA